MAGPAREITPLLERVQGGDRSALDELWARVEREVRAVAARQLSYGDGKRAPHVTTLVNEAYYRLFERPPVPPRLRHRAHFFGAVAQVMRRILIEGARSRPREIAIDLDALPDGRSLDTTWGWRDDLEELARALKKLEADGRHARKAEIVYLRFFAGRAVSEIAELCGVSSDTVTRDLRFARAWLRREMGRARGS